MMRAKMQVSQIDGAGTGQETLHFRAVCSNKAYPADGSDEDNSFALWTPSASLSMSVNNPALHGKFKVGDKFYLDFTAAE